MPEKKPISRDIPLAPTPEPNQDSVIKVFPLDVKKGYKSNVIQKETEEGTTATIKTRRTVGGFLSGKNKVGDIQIPAYNVPQRNTQSSPERSREQTGNKEIPRRIKK